MKNQKIYNLLYSRLYKNSSDLELIKYISIITMLIDHVGMMFYPGVDEFRIIGRFAYIGFSFLIAYNYKYNTRNKFDYRFRLLIWAMISQLIYNYIVPGELNILFLLLMSIYSIDSLEEIKQGKVFYPTFILASSLIVSLFSGYFIFGVLVIVLFYYSLEERKYFPYLVLSVAFLNFGVVYGIISLFWLYIIYKLHAPVKIKRIKGIIFYAFYPTHLLVLWLVSLV